MSAIFTHRRTYDAVEMLLGIKDPNCPVFERFQSPFGIDGLMSEKGPDLELLAVYAGEPGTGQFRRFISACKEKYSRVAVLEIWNEELPAILTRYGFTPFERTNPDGEHITGMEWNKI